VLYATIELFGGNVEYGLASAQDEIPLSTSLEAKAECKAV
jgi:hypothetical protein